MAALVYTAAEIFVDGYRLRGQFNELNIEMSAEALDVTTFGQSTRINKGGLRMGRISGSGLCVFGANSVEEVLFGDVGVDVLVAAFPNGVVEGEASGYAMPGTLSQFQLGGAVGVALPFSMAAEHAGS